VVAFGEEMVYRGFILGRLMYAFGGNRLGKSAALILQTVLFALGHTYPGPRGAALYLGVPHG
jgi:membrane protease YdiL (CAAX protease family)